MYGQVPVNDFHYKRQKFNFSLIQYTLSFFPYIEVIPSFVGGNIDRFRCFQKPGDIINQFFKGNTALRDIRTAQATKKVNRGSKVMPLLCRGGWESVHAYRKFMRN